MSWLVIPAVLALVAVGMGWECSVCGDHTGFLWPRPCRWGCGEGDHPPGD